MKASKLYNRVYVVLALILVFVNLINKDNIGQLPFDYALFAGVIVWSVFYGILKRNYSVPRGYIIILVPFVALMVFNSLVSSYAPPFIYSVLGGLITLLPFIYFIASYNFELADDDIHTFIQGIIAIVLFYALLLYVDTLFLHTGFGMANTTSEDSVLSSNIMRFGDFSSLCNQAIVMCLAEQYRTKRRQYWYVIAFLVITIALTNQLKAIAGMMIVFGGYMLFMTRIPKWLKITITSAVAVALILALSLSDVFTDKVDKYMESGMSETAYAEIARPALYYRSVEMAIDHFPIGTGQGTFGSVPANIIDSKVYEDYELNDVWGLDLDDELSFRMDTHWASVLGECGVLGLILYLMLFFYPANKLRKSGGISREYRFMVKMGVTTLFVESLVLALPKSFSFVAIYAGLSAVILRRQRQCQQQ